MLSHEQIWAAVDALAQKKQLSVSGLARQAGLDPTSFNKSKRTTGQGRLRWPSTESIAKALRATNYSLDEFMVLVKEVGTSTGRHAKSRAKRAVSTNASAKSGSFMPSRSIPLLGFAEAGTGGFFDDGGFPVGQGWDEVKFPVGDEDLIYALEVSGDSMLPLYRNGDVIIVNRGTQARNGDRVVVKTIEGEVMAKVLKRRAATQFELQSLNRDHQDRILNADEIDWIARIIWASQ